MPTLTELEASINRLQSRITALATSAQVQELLAALNVYKSGTDSRLNVIEGRLDAQGTAIADLELRVQDLET